MARVRVVDETSMHGMIEVSTEEQDPWSMEPADKGEAAECDEHDGLSRGGDEPATRAMMTVHAS